MNSHFHEAVKVHIRWMIRRDMPESLAIEADSFEFPWCENDFLRCLRQRNCIGMVAEQNERIVGFMIYELHKTRLHILNFAVSSRYRRLGVGAQMVTKLIGKLSTQRRNRILVGNSRDEPRRTIVFPLLWVSRGERLTRLLRRYARRCVSDAISLSR